MKKLPKRPTIALIVAAGSSSRLGGDVAKPYIFLQDRAVLSHVLKAFCCHPRIDGVRVVIARKDHPLYKKAAKGFDLFPPVVGGATRQESVRIGLEAIKRTSPAKVLIHDAARPLVDAQLIDRVLDGLEEAPAVLPALPVTDSIHQQGEAALTPLDRSALVAAQTPQGFHFEDIMAAHQRFTDQAVTDDIALAQLAGLTIKIVAGDERNIKLTTSKQITLLEGMMREETQNAAAQQDASQREVRVGQGFDVHAFEPHPSGANGQQTITLCGLKIPFGKKLKGHSDADVGIHALVDALLGAVAEGDIGLHFPPTDPAYKKAESKIFLARALEILNKHQAQITNIDLTIIGEEPKIAPHSTAMRQQLASLLGLDIRRVSIKATTTEKLGFLGRSEGLAAQAIATLTLPKEATT